MTPLTPGKSLRKSLVLFAALAISSLLGVAGFSFAVLFERHVEKYAVGELNSHFEQLVSGLSIDSNGALKNSAKLSDPRFDQPQGGLYWQIDRKDGASVRSRSMWDETFAVPTPPSETEEEHAHVMPGPGGIDVLALERLVILPVSDGQEHRLVVTIAMERDRVQNSVSSFGRTMLIGLSLLYLALLGATFTVILFGLRPLKNLRSNIEDLRTGRSTRIGGQHPEEVAPLVGEVNALVEGRERQLERARQRAGNLAHGLKTPLTVLVAIANDLEPQGQEVASKNIKLAAGQMRDLVDRELARSRMAVGEVGYRTHLLGLVERVVATLQRAPRGPDLQWRIAIPEATQVAMDPTDLLELLGNLIDNARKHAKACVSISHARDCLVVEDDGPGVPEEKLSSIAKRGVKLDALTPGSGLGLSIVSDLAEVYDLELNFAKSSLGGLRASVRLPALS